VGFALVQVLPTIAENLSELTSGDQDKVTSESSLPPEPVEIVETPPADGTDLTSEDDLVSEEANSNVTPTPQAPPPPPPPHATENQWMFIRIPSTIRVDPRASVAFLPTSNIISLNSLMVCLSSPTLKFDVGTQQVIDDQERGLMVVKGDMTNQVLFSGDPGVINNSILSTNGLRVFREGATLGGLVAQIRLVDVSEPTTDESLCDDGAKANIRELAIVPLGLTQSITKSTVDLGKKTKP